MRWKIKSIPLKPFSISYEIPTNDPWIQLIFSWIHKISLQPSNNLNGVLVQPWLELSLICALSYLVL